MEDYTYYSEKYDATVEINNSKVVSIDLGKPLSNSQLNTVLYEARVSYKAQAKLL